MKSQTWDVVVWTSEDKGSRREFATRDEAYAYARENYRAHVIEIYGPNGEYDAA